MEDTGLLPEQRKILTRRYRRHDYELLLGSCRGELCLAAWPGQERTIERAAALLGPLEPDGGNCPLLDRAAAELDEYFDGRRTEFDIHLLPCGTPFRVGVWEALRAIPYGSRISYGELARRLGRPAAVRAVASAVASNPLNIFIPCHRVVPSAGGTGGYAGGALTKMNLLQLERNTVDPALIF